MALLILTPVLNAVYLIGLETRHNLAQSAVNAVAENTSELIKRHLELYRDKLKSEFNNGGNNVYMYHICLVNLKINIFCSLKTKSELVFK